MAPTLPTLGEPPSSSCSLKVLACVSPPGPSQDHLQVSGPVPPRVPPAVAAGQPEERRRVSAHSYTSTPAANDWLIDWNVDFENKAI